MLTPEAYEMASHDLLTQEADGTTSQVLFLPEAEYTAFQDLLKPETAEASSQILLMPKADSTASQACFPPHDPGEIVPALPPDLCKPAAALPADLG